ncbi:hypothetical protein JSY36_06565 [Bacillus sp. H-16]|nr:hypothetical protein [Alteribacter salitolerans]MBM7095409.1 hypothetical protein [Alteribacter salitolerans]
MPSGRHCYKSELISDALEDLQFPYEIEGKEIDVLIGEDGHVWVVYKSD